VNAVVVAASATHIGNVREGNEDALLADEKNEIFIIADGMGGHAAGEVASHSVVLRAHEAWTSDSMARHREAYAQRGGVEARRSLLRAVREGVIGAHLDLMEQAEIDHRKAGMGTTFTGFLLAGGEAVFAHAGDSRAYLVRDGIAIQLSEDHTVISQLTSMGAGPQGEQFDPDALRQWRGQLTNSLGNAEETRVATFAVPLYDGDRIVLCTDGVYEYTDESELAQVVTNSTSPARAVNRLIECALERGGRDNCTAIIVKIVEAGVTRVPREQREKDEAAINESRLFCDLSQQDKLRALRITTYRDLKADKPVPGIALGCRVAHVILEGQVKLPTGELLGPSDIVYPDAFEFDSIFSEVQTAATVTPVRMLTIRCEDFFELCDEETDLGDQLRDAALDLNRGRN
jgi:serine/threonine protein phosphatase PrpC